MKTYIFIISLLLISFVSCRSANQPTSEIHVSSTPSNSATEVDRFTPNIPVTNPSSTVITIQPTRNQTTPTLTPTATPPPNPFLGLPMALGNRWIYQSEFYESEYTMKCRVIDTVTEIINEDGNFTAQILREIEKCEGDQAIGYFGYFKLGYNMIQISNTSVIFDSSLELLRLPLADNLNWAHSIRDGKKENPTFGKNAWANGPFTKKVVNFNRNCFEVIYQYLGGGIGT
jgi:hypothetical protein